MQWSNRDTDWDYFPGGNEPIIPPGGAGTWVEHAKLNVVRSVKRGLSDFYPIDGNLELARRVLRNMGEGSAVQAAIAWIQEVAPGTTQAQVSTGTLARADGSYTTLTQQGASRTHPVQQYDPATILKVPSGQKYLPGPLGAQHAPNFITAAEALLRTVALRWNLPENLITGSAANNNFASSLVAETPFVKYAESQQQYYAQRDRKTLWRVLWFAWSAGRFGDVPWPTLRKSLEITVTPPQIEVRDPEKETRVRQMLHAAGILSRKTWSAQESLDYDREEKNLQQEAEADVPAQPSRSELSSKSHATDNDESRRTESGRTAQSNDGTPTEALEAWDPDKHPRGGYSQNRGWFSKAWGGGIAALGRALGLGRSVSGDASAAVRSKTVGKPATKPAASSPVAKLANSQTSGSTTTPDGAAANPPNAVSPVPATKTVRPSPTRGTWIEGTPGNGTFQYADTPQNRADGVAGQKVRFENEHIALGGFPPEWYYGGSAASASVQLDGPPKGTNADNLAADAKMREKLGDRNWKRPGGYRWNHAGEPGSKTMELVKTEGHVAVAHKGSAAAPRAASRAGKAIGRAFAALQVYTTVRDALQAAGVAQPDYDIEHADYYFTAEDSSVFIIEKPTLTSKAKQVFVAGPRAGQTVTLTTEQFQQYKAAAEKVWGRYEPGSLFRGPRFYPGEKRKTLPYYEYRDGYRWEVGWIDENGVHRYTRPRPPEA